MVCFKATLWHLARNVDTLKDLDMYNLVCGQDMNQLCYKYKIKHTDISNLHVVMCINLSAWSAVQCTLCSHYHPFPESDVYCMQMIAFTLCFHLVNSLTYMNSTCVTFKKKARLWLVYVLTRSVDFSLSKQCINFKFSACK